MTPATFDFSVVRGAAGPGQGLKVQLKTKASDGTLSNIPFDDVRLSIYNRQTFLLRLTIGNGEIIVTDPTNAEVEWRPTTVESRLIPKGARATYELEVRNGSSEAVYLVGTITGIGGINDDIGDDAS
jgi:hypothetical protein